MSLGSNIRKRRYELKLSQEELAKFMGYKSKSTIAKIESSENGVPLKKIEKFAKVLDTSVEALVSDYLVEANDSYKEAIDGRKNIVVILAGGKSSRNQQNIPNQFISVYGTPVIMYSMKAYENHPAISDIYVVCLKGWEDIVLAYAKKFKISKLKGIISGGETGIQSIKKAVDFLEGKCNMEDTIIFQESTRPLVNEENISRLLLEYQKHGSAVTCGSMSEHLQFFKKGNDLKYVDRNYLIEIQSPEAYRYKNLNKLFKKAEKIGYKYTETCLGMFMYNLSEPPHFFEGELSNVKIIRKEDIALFAAYIKSNEFE